MIKSLFKNIVVLGGQESGVGAAILAKLNNLNIFVSDIGTIKDNYKQELIKYLIPFEENGHQSNLIFQADVIIKSPGIPDTNFIKNLIDKGIKIISDIEFAYYFKGESKIVAITGTNGKSTTTALLQYICEVAKLNSAMVGNIGISICKQIALDPKMYYITEVSSYQLDGIEYFKSHIAILLNITPDHLQRYEYKFQNYILSKFRIVMNQTADDCLIYNFDDDVITNFLKHNNFSTQLIPFSMSKSINPGVIFKSHIMNAVVKKETLQMSSYEFSLKGSHNYQNIMAATAAAQTLGIRNEKIKEALKGFVGLPHRLEYVTTIEGVHFINDSKSTNVNCTWFALESMTNNVILIMGGQEKPNPDYSILDELVTSKVKTIICLGKDNTNIINHFKNKVAIILDYDNMFSAVKMANELATKNDSVLLSPACASFDLFENFEDRGNQFKKAVNLL